MTNQSENRFNLIDQPWIPVVNAGLVSLRDIFSNHNYIAIGGNPVQKIAITKLLLAIAQSAFTPDDDESWSVLGSEGLSAKCISYLDKWHDRFWLYGEMPFLQMPSVSVAKLQSFGGVISEIATGNTTVLTQSQIEKPLSDADKALLIVVLMGFALGGKKTDNSVVLAPGYTGKTNESGKIGSGRYGPSLGFKGFMHSFLTGKSICETLWLNLFTSEQIKQIRTYSSGLGVAPWEIMPASENCETAKVLQSSLMGRLVPVSRFCLLSNDGIHYTEGVAHQDYKDGMADPSISVNASGKTPVAIWIDPEKKSWRILTALLSFLSQSKTSGFDCLQLRFGLLRARKHVAMIGIWSGGLRVSFSTGEQFFSGADDFVESLIVMPSETFDSNWFTALESEMAALEQLSKAVFGATKSYFKSQNLKGDAHARKASNLFWQLCDRSFNDLCNACSDANETILIRKTLAGFASQAYDTFCAKDTARQLDAWARNKPNLGIYLKDLFKTDINDGVQK